MGPEALVPGYDDGGVGARLWDRRRWCPAMGAGDVEARPWGRREWCLLIWLEALVPVDALVS